MAEGAVEKRKVRQLVADNYVGRHRRAAAAGAPAPIAAVANSGALRPLIHAGATVALAGATVAGYLTSGAIQAAPQAGADGATLSLDAVRISDVTATQMLAAREAEGELVSTKITAPTRLAAAAAARADEAVAAQAAAAEATRLEAERAAAAEQASLDAQRASILASAQANPKAVAQLMGADHGWNDAQFQCLNKLWTKESNWNYRATNRSSGAYGIPQSLPGSKMATIAADWRTNPATQIAWGLKYIASVYGTPCGAWSHSVRTNWY